MYVKVGITQAKEICNTVRKNFPYESPWYQSRVIHRDLILSCKDSSRMRDVVEINKKLTEQNIALENVRDLYQPLFKNPFQYFKELIASVHKYQVQNCGELARITYAVSRMNGIKNSDLGMAHVIAKEKRKQDLEKLTLRSFLQSLSEIDIFAIDDEYVDGILIDHVATQIKSKSGDSLVVDAMFDECGTDREMETLYGSKYGDPLGIKENEKVEILNLESFYEDFPILRDKDVKKLVDIFPSLVMPQNKDILDKSRSYFMTLASRFKK